MNSQELVVGFEDMTVCVTDFIKPFLLLILMFFLFTYFALFIYVCIYVVAFDFRKVNFKNVST